MTDFVPRMCYYCKLLIIYAYLKYFRSCTSFSCSLITFPGTAFSVATTTLDLSLVVNTQYFLSFCTPTVCLVGGILPSFDPLDDDLLPEESLPVCLKDAECPIISYSNIVILLNGELKSFEFDLDLLRTLVYY